VIEVPSGRFRQSIKRLGINEVAAGIAKHPGPQIEVAQRPPL
jgi:hypothetical protein